MKLENVIVERPYKKVYRCDEGIAKVFEPSHPKEDVFNEALNQARVEATGLNIPKVKSVNEIDGKWALVIDYKEGKTLEELMQENPDKVDEYMEQFVDLQLEIHSKTAPLLGKLKDKLNRQINSLKDVVDATTRYELLTRLDSMPKHHKVCHGDFNPSNVIVGEDGTLYVVDWAHATQGNASADAAMTYLLFERSEARRQIYESVLQKERHCKTVCTAVASDCCSSTAYKETCDGTRFPYEMDRYLRLSINYYDLKRRTCGSGVFV